MARGGRRCPALVWKGVGRGAGQVGRKVGAATCPVCGEQFPGTPVGQARAAPWEREDRTRRLWAAGNGVVAFSKRMYKISS